MFKNPEKSKKVLSSAYKVISEIKVNEVLKSMHIGLRRPEISRLVANLHKSIELKIFNSFNIKNINKYLIEEVNKIVDSFRKTNTNIDNSNYRKKVLETKFESFESKLAEWKSSGSYYFSPRLKYENEFWKTKRRLLPKGDNSALIFVKKIMLDEQAFFNRLNDIHNMITKRMLDYSESSADATEKVLEGIEKANGFLKTTLLKRRLQRTHIQGGALFKDLYFDSDKIRSHGQQTHRIQWAAIMLEKNTHSYMKNYNGKKLYQLFSRKMNFNDVGWGYAWQSLFDSFEANYTCSEYLTGQFYYIFPNITW